MAEVLTYCRICEPMCGLRVEVEEGRVRRIRGDPDHPLSRGWVCGRAGAFAEVHNDPDRLRRPLRRGAAGFEEVDWESALAAVSGRLGEIRRANGPDAVAVYLGNPMAFCTYGALSVPAFARALGTSRFFTSGSQDCNNKFAACERVFGSPVLQPIPDLDRVEYLLILGANPAVSGMSFVQVPRPAETLLKIRRRGGRIVVVDPRRNETAKLATEHLFIQPDTDCFFLLSILWVLMEQGRVERRWVEEDPRGYELLREVVRQWPPERTEPVTGIPREKTEEVARCLSGPRPAACYGSVGINLGRNGTLTYWLLTVVNLLSGHFDRPGGSFFCRGVVPVDRLYAWSGLDRGKRRSAVGDFPPVMGTYPAALMAREILEAGKGRIRALVVVAGNPLLSVPNEARLREALERLDLLVCLDIYRNETGSLAHYLLPTTDFLEREDLNFSHTGLQLRRFAAWSPAVVAPEGDQRQEWEILESISSRMGLALWGRGLGTLAGAEARWRSARGRLPGAWRQAALRARALRRLLSPGVAPSVPRECEPALPGGSAAGKRGVPRLLFQLLLRLLGETDFRSLQAAPRGLALKPHRFGALRFGSRFGGRRLRLAPEDLLREARKLEGYLALLGAERGKLLLVGRRERHTHNTWLHNVDGLLKGETTNYLYLHPEDAAPRGIREGELIEIDGLEGDRVQVPCRFTEDLKRGVIALPHGWGHRYAAGWSRANRRPGVNVNRLASDAVWRIEPVVGNAWLTGLPVEIRKVGASAVSPETAAP